MPTEFTIPLSLEELDQNSGTDKYAIESAFDINMGGDAMCEALEGTHAQFPPARISLIGP